MPFAGQNANSLAPLVVKHWLSPDAPSSWAMDRIAVAVPIRNDERLPAPQDSLVGVELLYRLLIHPKRTHPLSAASVAAFGAVDRAKEAIPSGRYEGCVRLVFRVFCCPQSLKR